MTTMPLLYIAAPYRAPTVDGIRDNIRFVERMSAWVLGLGVYPVAPHLLTSFMDGRVGDEKILATTLELMRRCDAVLVVKRKASMSRGVSLEYDEALRLKMVHAIFGPMGDDSLPYPGDPTHDFVGRLGARAYVAS